MICDSGVNEKTVTRTIQLRWIEFPRQDAWHPTASKYRSDAEIPNAQSFRVWYPAAG